MYQRQASLLEQLLLLELQLQHDGVELHVQVVGSLQLPLVVLPDVQRMPAATHRAPRGRHIRDSVAGSPRTRSVHSCVSVLSVVFRLEHHWG